MADNTPQPPVPNAPVSPAAPAPDAPASPAAPAPTASAAAVASTTPAPAVATPAASGEVVPVLSVQHFTKKYGSKVAVSDLSIDVMPGDIYGFIGHNGAALSHLRVASFLWTRRTYWLILLAQSRSLLTFQITQTFTSS